MTVPINEDEHVPSRYPSDELPRALPTRFHLPGEHKTARFDQCADFASETLEQTQASNVPRRIRVENETITDIFNTRFAPGSRADILRQADRTTEADEAFCAAFIWNPVQVDVKTDKRNGSYSVPKAPCAPIQPACEISKAIQDGLTMYVGMNQHARTVRLSRRYEAMQAGGRAKFAREQSESAKRGRQELCQRPLLEATGGRRLRKEVVGKVAVGRELLRLGG